MRRHHALMSPTASMTVARTVGLTWAVLLYSGMLIVGWAVRATMQVGHPEDAIYEASKNLLPVVVDGEIVIRPMMYIALSYDHRLIDGREAVTALKIIKEAIEDPTRMLIDL